MPSRVASSAPFSAGRRSDEYARGSDPHLGLQAASESTEVSVDLDREVALGLYQQMTTGAVARN